MDTLFTMLDTIRTQILEYFIIPGLGISWWKFSLILLTLGIVIKVLVNAVLVSGSGAAHDSRDRERAELREQARAKARANRKRGGH